MKCLLDTETTDLLSNSRDWFAQPGIVQLAAVKLDDQLLVVDRLNVLVNPEKSRWSEEAIKTHGIVPEKVRDAPTFYEVGKLLAEFILGCDTIAGYNVQFDKDVIWHQLLRYGLHQNFPWPLKDFDVMRRVGSIIQMQGKRGTKHPKLSEAYEFCFGRPMQGAHDAMYDVEATVEVWRWTTLYGDAE